MKLTEALKESLIASGAYSMVSPGAFTGQQVVQPITRQAVDPNQTVLNKKIKSKKSPKKANFSDYNDDEVDDLNIYYDFADDKTADQFKKLISKLKGSLKSKEKDED